MYRNLGRVYVCMTEVRCAHVVVIVIVMPNLRTFEHRTVLSDVYIFQTKPVDTHTYCSSF